MLTVRLPTDLAAGRRYVVDVVLGEFLGIPFQVAAEPSLGEVCIEGEGRRLTVADVFFSNASARWLKRKSFFPEPGEWNTTLVLPEVALNAATVPFVFAAAGDKREMVTMDEQGAHCSLDIFGTVFFLLTRYEEAMTGVRDRHDRVPINALCSFQRCNLHRPLVDEYVEILWALLQRLWPGLARKPRHFRMVLTHDVDQPFLYAFAPAWRMARRMAGDVVRRRSLRLAVTTAADWVAVRLGRPERDPCNQFDWMMEQSERRGLRSAFYFICGGTAGTVDGDYRMEYPLIRALVHRIATRGHEIGLHGSYNSYRDEKQLLREFARLKQVCAEESVRQQEWGGRQHFLRWRSPESIRHWDQAGLAYDSTLAFAELAGFRCGTCHEFPGFDLATQEPLRVRERPLVVMECSVIDACYMGLGETAAAYDAIASLKRTCRRFDGNFTLLWHNSRLSTPRQRELYVSVLDA